MGRRKQQRQNPENTYKKHWVDINGNPLTKYKDEESKISAIKIDPTQEQEDTPSAPPSTPITEHNTVLITEENHTDAPEEFVNTTLEEATSVNTNNNTEEFINVELDTPIDPMVGADSYGWFGLFAK